MLTVMSSEPDGYDDELRALAESIERAETVLAELRQRRDRTIREAVRIAGYSERRAAAAALVAPSYAHRAARAGR
jgi:hypothetical protein